MLSSLTTPAMVVILLLSCAMNQATAQDPGTGAAIAFPIVGSLMVGMIIMMIIIVVCYFMRRTRRLRGILQPPTTIVPTTPYTGSSTQATAVVPLRQYQQMSGQPQGQPSAPLPAVNAELSSQVPPPSYRTAGTFPAYTPQQVQQGYPDNQPTGADPPKVQKEEPSLADFTF